MLSFRLPKEAKAVVSKMCKIKREIRDLIVKQIFDRFLLFYCISNYLTCLFISRSNKKI